MVMQPSTFLIRQDKRLEESPINDWTSCLQPIAPFHGANDTHLGAISLPVSERLTTKIPLSSMAMALISALTLVLAILAVYLLKTLLQRNDGKHPPLPPGPKPKFLVGNLTDLPKPGELECVHWLRHKDLYGAYQ
jgi:hypothetical protein